MTPAAFSAAQRRRAASELLRFGLVGVALNVSLYLAYLGLMRFGLDYRAAMSVTYVVGVVAGYALHGRYTFKVHNDAGAFTRYVLAYAAGYVLNLAGLSALVGMAAVSREASQAVMIVVVAGVLFLLQKTWVYRASASRSSKECS
jgi:putative flippase GtrA